MELTRYGGVEGRDKWVMKVFLGEVRNFNGFWKTFVSNGDMLEYLNLWFWFFSFGYWGEEGY